MNERTTNWRKLISDEADKNGELFSSLIINIEDGELDRMFLQGFGGTEGAPFTAWGPQFVYFPIQYDGSEWAGSAPRNPCEIRLEHQGGG